MTMIDNYESLTIGKYLEIQAIEADQSLEDIDRQVRVLSVLTGRSERDLLNAPIAEYRELAARSEFLTRQPAKIGRPALAYALPGGWDLVATSDLRRITTAQYIDFQTYAEDPDRYAVELLSVFLVPRGKHYNDGYDVAQVQAAVRDNLSVAEVLALTAFFLSRYARLMRVTTRSSERLARRIKDPARRAMELARVERMKLAMARLSRAAGDGSTT